MHKWLNDMAHETITLIIFAIIVTSVGLYSGI